MKSSKTANAKMDEDMVRVLRKNHARGISAREMAEWYSLSLETVRRIIRRDTWAWVKDEVELGELPLPAETPEMEAEIQASLRRTLEAMKGKADWVEDKLKELGETAPKNPMEEEEDEVKAAAREQAKMFGARV